MSEQQKKALAVAASLAATAAVIHHSPYLVKQPMYDSDQTGYKFMTELLNGHPIRFYNAIGMSPHVFQQLLVELEQDTEVTDSRSVTAAEQLMMFLFHCREGCSTRAVQERFQHAPGTVTKYVIV